MRNREFHKKVDAVFREYYQTTIEELRQEHPQYGNMTNAALVNIQDDFLITEIKKRNVYFNFEKLTEAQVSVFYKALAQQIYYVLTEGDFVAMSGYDVTTNSFAPRSEFKARALAPAARATLETAGLFYSGLGVNARPTYRGGRL